MHLSLFGLVEPMYSFPKMTFYGPFTNDTSPENQPVILTHLTHEVDKCSSDYTK